jgi:acetyl esterase
LDFFPSLLETWGGDPNNIVFCGQSAGGNLAAAVLQRRRWTAELGVKAQVLCYLPTDNYNDHFHGAELDARGRSTEYYGFFYNRIFDERKNSDVSILFASDEELRRLPPTDIVTAGLDNLCAEGKAYYNRLAAVGAAGEYRCFEHSRHGFLVNLYDEWQEGEDYVVNRILAYLQH